MTAVTPPISDHSGTVLSINTPNFKKPPREITLYEYENATRTEISNRLTELDTAVSNHIDIDSTVNEFTKILIDIRNDCVPHKKVNPTARIIQPRPISNLHVIIGNVILSHSLKFSSDKPFPFFCRMKYFKKLLTKAQFPRFWLQTVTAWSSS